MKRKGQVNGILALSIGLILTIIILSVVFSFVTDQTATTEVPIDQFTISNTSCVRITETDCIAGLTNIVNATGIAPANLIANFTICDVSGVDQGVIMDNAGAEGNALYNGQTANATYDTRDCGYITSSTTRTLVTLIPLLLAIAMLIFAVGFLVLKR